MWCDIWQAGCLCWVPSPCECGKAGYSRDCWEFVNIVIKLFHRCDVTMTNIFAEQCFHHQAWKHYPLLDADCRSLIPNKCWHRFVYDTRQSITLECLKRKVVDTKIVTLEIPLIQALFFNACLLGYIFAFSRQLWTCNAVCHLSPAVYCCNFPL